MDPKKVNDELMPTYTTDFLLSMECSDCYFNKITSHLRVKKNMKIMLSYKSKDLHKRILFKSATPRPLSEFIEAEELLEKIFTVNTLGKQYLVKRKPTTDPSGNVSESNSKKKLKKNKVKKKKKPIRHVSKNLEIQISNNKVSKPKIAMKDSSIIELDTTNPEDIIDLTNTNDITLIDLTHSTKKQNIVSKNTITKEQEIESANEAVDIIDLTQSFIESPKISSNHCIAINRKQKIENKKLQPTISFIESPKINTTSMNIFNPNRNTKKEGLRPIIIDGSNVAMGHSNGKHFSWKGIEICITYFKKLGHQVIAFVPKYRQYSSNGVYKDLVDKLVENKELVLTPSRVVDGKILTPYDDRYIIQSAVELGGVIVSSDNYRDLMNENSTWKETITNRLLMFTWVGDILMFPQDPLGRHGPKLDTFLKFP